MKKLLLFLLLVPMVSFGQDEKTYNKWEKETHYPLQDIIKTKSFDPFDKKELEKNISKKTIVSSSIIYVDDKWFDRIEIFVLRKQFKNGDEQNIIQLFFIGNENFTINNIMIKPPIYLTRNLGKINDVGNFNLSNQEDRLRFFSMYGVLKNSEGKGIIEFVKMKYMIDENFEGDFNPIIKIFENKRNEEYGALIVPDFSISHRFSYINESTKLNSPLLFGFQINLVNQSSVKEFINQLKKGENLFLKFSNPVPDWDTLLPEELNIDLFNKVFKINLSGSGKALSY